MINMELIRELHCYKKMYDYLQQTITECINAGRDPVVTKKLIEAQQEAEDIYTGEIYEYKSLNADERIIVELLNFISDNEVTRVIEEDMELVNSCIKWSLAIQNKKVDLSKEYIEAQVKKIIDKADEKWIQSNTEL